VIPNLFELLGLRRRRYSALSAWQSTRCVDRRTDSCGLRACSYGVYYSIPNALADFLLIVDICLHFCTAYKNQKSVMIHDLAKIRRHYLGTSFPLHFVVAFPIDYIIWGVFVGSGNPTPSHTIALMRLFKLVRGIQQMRRASKASATDTKADSVRCSSSPHLM
jgi:hypothetical protein